tara:strand:- start:93 stop:506 length:414 start_codon:yes stop_codon:yes gene_type:complete
MLARLPAFRKEKKMTTKEKLTPTTSRFANQCGYSDVHPYEIVRIVSEKCIEVRAMDTSENKTVLSFIAGGFSAHCANQQAQEYEYISNPGNPVIKIRKNKDGNTRDRITGEPRYEWKGKMGRFVIAAKPHKFFDYNF